MSIGIKAMTANYASLQTTSHNIANANVAGYSRQQVQLATAQGQFSGAGFFGQGVDVVAVTRAHDAFLTGEAAGARSLAGMDATRLEQLRRLESIFRPGESGLGHAADSFLNSLVDLVSRPADLSARQVVLARAGDLAARFAEAGAALDEAQAAVTIAMRTEVEQVNALARSIAATNQRIGALRGSGQPANDLLDQRDQLIAELSQHVKVSRVESPDGTVAVFVGGGQRLVLGSEAAQLRLVPDGADPSRMALAVQDGSYLRPLTEAAVGGGSIAGLLRFQNHDLPDARNRVGQLAAAVGGAVNEQQQRGLSLRLPLGEQPAAGLFSLGPALALAHADNVRDAGGRPLGSVELTRVDPAALQPSDYELREDPAAPGSWQLTRLSDGLVRGVASGDVVDGMRIDFEANPPQPGDRYLLQPVARAANGMARLLDDPRDLAAAAPLLVSTDPGNIGSAGVAGLAVTASPLPEPGATTRLTFTDDSGAYAWELLDADNGLVASGSGTWQPGQPIPAPPLDINGYSLQLAGVPRGGDIVTVEPMPAAALAVDNGNARALLDLRDAALAGGNTITEAWSLALADIGVRVQSAASTAEISTAVARQAETARSAVSGVNLDEEAARLIHFQQSYQAAAKVLQVAQSLFDTLLQAASGR